MKSEIDQNAAQTKRDWVTHPTKRNLVIVIAVWFVGTSLLILAITDLFQQSFFSNRSLVIEMMMMVSTLTMSKVVWNYLRNSGGK